MNSQVTVQLLWAVGGILGQGEGRWSDRPRRGVGLAIVYHICILLEPDLLD